MKDTTVGKASSASGLFKLSFELMCHCTLSYCEHEQSMTLMTICSNRRPPVRPRSR